MKILRPADAARMLSVSKCTLWRWTKEPDFPKPFRLGSHSIGYDEAELVKWAESRRAQAGV